MKLFYSPGACSLSPHIILLEAHIDCALEKVDLKTKKTEKGTDFLTINQKGKVPVLVLNDKSILTEGIAIVQYLADHASNCQLMPPIKTLPRYHTIEWLSYISTELHKGFVPLFNPKTPDAYVQMARETLEKQFQYLDAQLKNQNYLQGDPFYVADAYLFTILRWAIAMKFDLKRHEHLFGYFARVNERPSVKAALKTEGLS